MLNSDMIFYILCHYTFFSNEVSRLGSLVMLIFIAICFIFAIRIWFGNKIDNHKYNDAQKRRRCILTSNANALLSKRSSNDTVLERIEKNSNWRDWFIKGYLEGAEHGNCYFSPNAPIKPESEFTLEEWQDYQKLQTSHIADDSQYFGGNKGMALDAFFLGHKHGLALYQSQH